MTDIIKEISRSIESSPDESVATFGDGDALSERIREWLETPVGTVADLPGWGNNLSSFKFDPMNSNLEVAIELAIVEKMSQDINDLVFLGVGVEFIDIDLCVITIRHQFGDTVTEKKL